jgi:hypothetical protein
MCACGEGHHGHGHCQGWGYDPGRWCGPRDGYGRSYDPGSETRDHLIEDLQEYKQTLETEIRRLEKRMGSLRGTSPSD